MENFGNSSIKKNSGKILNINENLEELQKKKLVDIFQKHSSSYAWEYIDMKGIYPKTYMHHIYIEENARPVWQPQRRMNPIIKEIVKELL